jgi:signal transduction histidine kinase
MSLSKFIRDNSERLLTEWENFARKLAGGSLSRWALRDHAPAIIRNLAEDLESTPLSARHDPAPIRQDPPAPKERPTLAHVNIRIESGFDLAQVIDEYCALRSCILRLWRDTDPDAFYSGAEEISRFAEVLDRYLGSAVLYYKERETQYRDRFLAILGHDLRNPINTVLLSASSLDREGLAPSQSRAAERILSTTRRISGMVNDMLDFARGRLGIPMPINKTRANLGIAIRDVVEEVRAANPGRVIHLDANGDLEGDWDVERLKQMVSNLLINAVQHGNDEPVEVVARSEGNVVALEVHNKGQAIPPEQIAKLFDPLIRSSYADTDKVALGLGLFIVNEIVSAHGGTIAVSSSSDAGTNFVVRLPRKSA